MLKNPWYTFQPQVIISPAATVLALSFVEEQSTLRILNTHTTFSVIIRLLGKESVSHINNITNYNQQPILRVLSRISTTSTATTANETAVHNNNLAWRHFHYMFHMNTNFS